MCFTPRPGCLWKLSIGGRAWLLMLALSGLARGAVAGAQDGTAGARIHLQGSVVNGATGKPIARALVVSGDQRLAAMTDTEGHFAMEVTPRAVPGLRMGVLSLTARKPGFSQFVQPTVVTLDPASPPAALELKLMPVCSIGGQVRSPNGEPAGEVNVWLLQRRVEEGERVWRQMNARRTDSGGEFRFSNLEPGEYTVLTGEWRGDQPVPPQQQQRKTITTEYPPDYAGDVSSLDAATKLQLHFGDAPRVELHLHAARYYPITIPVAGGFAGVGVQVGSAGAAGSPANFGGFTLSYNDRDHAVEGSLPAGDYLVNLSQRSGSPRFAVLPIHVADAPFEGPTVALAPGVTIPVRVEKQFTKAEDSAVVVETMSSSTGGLQAEPAVQIFLRPLDMSGPGVNSKVGADGAVEFDEVPPGVYTVRSFAMRGYVASLTSAGVDLLHHPLVVSQEGRVEPIDMILRDDTGTVAGTINPGNDPRPLPQVTFLALIPDGATGTYTQGFATPNGKFQVANVPPGSYRVLAFRGNYQQIAYRDAKSMEAWNGKGAPVTVTSSGTAQVDVPLLDESEAQPE